ncbi:hypothetical protein EB796_021438 [Bugula neritina]|uniref:Uncharacterized protein n=1 Tax=Bugula neritina TaxID=10212 RepID=A0A7J7J3N2_BUGNE|nr:hypothetical protein EB796_021438 [Bugula neritina]
MFERLTSEDCDLWYTEERPRRPLLYDSKGGSDRRARRRTDTDIRYLTDVLTAEQQVSHLSDAANSETRNDFSLSREQYSDSSPQTKVSRRKNTSEFSKQRRQTVSVDGIYFAKRVMSVEDNGVSNSQVAESEYMSDGDEFFLATDFDTPLPKLMYTQSVDYLDSLIRTEQHLHLDSTRR